MNRLFSLIGLIVLSFFVISSVRAQEDEIGKFLCEINFLRLEGETNTGDFGCSTIENITDLLLPSNVTLTPLSELDFSTKFGEEGNSVLKFVIGNLNGTYDSSLLNGSSLFTILVGFSEESFGDDDDSEEDDDIARLNITLSSAVMASLSFDFDGDSIVDRVELYSAFLLKKALDDDESDSEDDGFFAYVGTADKIRQVVGSGYSNFTNGSVQLALWSPFGSSHLLIKIGADIDTVGEVSSISFPFIFDIDIVETGTQIETTLGTATIFATSTETGTATEAL